jgi:hypothetical protein
VGKKTATFKYIGWVGSFDYHDARAECGSAERRDRPIWREFVEPLYSRRRRNASLQDKDHAACRASGPSGIAMVERERNADITRRARPADTA